MDDLISRKAALDALEWKWAGEAAIDAIKNLPSAQPERKQGKWEEEMIDDFAIERWQSAKCSACGLYHTTPYMYYFSRYNYCPNCGADMRKEKSK